MFGEKETYKYFEILHADTIKQEDMKEKSKDISGELGSYWKPEYSWNLIKTKHVCAVLLVR